MLRYESTCRPSRPGNSSGLSTMSCKQTPPGALTPPPTVTINASELETHHNAMQASAAGANPRANGSGQGGREVSTQHDWFGPALDYPAVSCLVPPGPLRASD